MMVIYPLTILNYGLFPGQKEASGLGAAKNQCVRFGGLHQGSSDNQPSQTVLINMMWVQSSRFEGCHISYREMLA
jgi:hypothetical protein